MVIGDVKGFKFCKCGYHCTKLIELIVGKIEMFQPGGGLESTVHKA